MQEKLDRQTRDMDDARACMGRQMVGEGRDTKDGHAQVILEAQQNAMRAQQKMINENKVGEERTRREGSVLQLEGELLKKTVLKCEEALEDLRQKMECLPVRTGAGETPNALSSLCHELLALNGGAGH